MNLLSKTALGFVAIAATGSVAAAAPAPAATNTGASAARASTAGVMTRHAASANPSPQIRVSGFNLRNKASGKCLKANGKYRRVIVVKCSKNSVPQRWANVVQMLQSCAYGLGAQDGA